MAQEIERKFLLRDDRWRRGEGRFMCQGCLSDSTGTSVRVRLAGDDAWLTVKGPSSGASRAEYEYAIPVADARAMLASLARKPFSQSERKPATGR